MNEKEFEELVFVIALENAINYSGKTNPKALIGKIMPKYPEIKNDMNHYMNSIENITNQVNSLSLEKQKEKLLELNPEKLEKKENSKETKNIDELIDLPNHKGKIITRFSPAPSGNLHLGHLFAITYNYEYVKKYGGKFILRIEDTNPENIDIENYQPVIDDVKWLTDEGIDELYYQSDRIDIYYKYLRQLIETNKAYVCECQGDSFKLYNDSKEACPHRDSDKGVELYEKFFNGEYKEGDAAIRFKGNLKDKNPALRDFPIARLKDEKHPRVGNKYRLWPMYNLCTAIDDSIMGINYVIRGKDHEINGERQDMIKDALLLKKCSYFHTGRTNFIDIELSKTKLSQKIKDREFTGWDDPRVPTLLSHRKRGYKAEAFRKMIIRMGISKRDSKISSKEFYKSLDFFNKQILEKISNRYFFVHNPKKVIIKNISKFPDKKIELPKHPEDKSKGNREFKLDTEYYIDSIDFDNIKENEIIRLMHFANFKIIKKNKNELELEFLSKEYDKNLKLSRNIHFVPKENESCTIILEDNSKLNGICEILGNLKEDTNLQFERFAFVRLDRIEKGKKIFYYTHR